tara:strand:- start:168 stop:695 length:528 start_codon:yes stop_codon:yes gene_type:complete
MLNFFLKVVKINNMNFIKNYSYLIILSLSLNVDSATVSFETDVDEFTDEKSHSLTISSDVGSTLTIVGIYCEEDWLNFMISNQDMYLYSDFTELKVRFDKDSMYTQEVNVYNNKYVYTQDASFINSFINRLRTSQQFIIKVGDEDTAIFSDYTLEARAEIANYLKAAKKIDACNF